MSLVFDNLAGGTNTGGGGTFSAGVSTGGNTAGTTGVVNGQLVFVGGSNISLSQSVNGQSATISFNGGAAGGLTNIKVSAGTLSALRSDLTFGDSNGISFGLDTNGIITGTVKTNYLTTAMASNRGSDFVQATAAFNGTNASGTIASNAISVSVNAQSNQSAIKAFGVSNTGATAGNTGVSTGIDWVMAGSNLITLSQSTAVGGPNTVWIQHPAWLTTARASNDAIGLNTAQTNVTWTVNSSGISLNAGGYAGTGFTSTTTAGTAVVGTHNTAGLSLGVPLFITTARASTDAIGLNTAQTNVTWTVNSSGISLNAGGYAGTGFTTTTTAGTAIVGTHNTAGLSMGIPNFITTAASSLTNIRVSAGTTSNLLSAITFADSNGVSWGINASTITATVSTYTPVDIATAVNAVASANSTGTVTRWAPEDHRHAGIGAVGISTAGNTAGTTGSEQGTYWFQGGANVTLSQITSNNGSHTLIFSAGGGTGGAAMTFSAGTLTETLASLVFSDSNGVSFGLNGSTLTATVSTYSTVGTATTAYPVATANSVGTVARWAAEDHRHASFSGTFSNAFEPFYLLDNTATSTGSLSQIGIQPFTVGNYISFGQMNMIGVATVVPTSGSHNWSIRLTNSTQAMLFSAQYSISNWNFVDLFLFSRGSGVFSSEIETFASTRNSFLTVYQVTQSHSATLTNTAGGSIKASQSMSMSISYPFITSTTATSINVGSTYTSWGTGYTTWTSTASNITSDTYSTSVAKALALGSTYPATVGWSGTKLLHFNFGSSLSPGEYWLGVVRYSSQDSASASGSTFSGAAGAGTSYSYTYNATDLKQTQMLTFAGKTMTSQQLGSLGFVTTGNMAAEFGLGTFSNTWVSSATYLNNLGNPNGAVAFTQLRSGASYFQSWFQMNSNRMV